MPLPNLIIIGAAKCGTSALWYNLDKHPDISMAVKAETSIEMNFWGAKDWNKGLKWYTNHFEKNKIMGEKTPKYYLSKHSMNLIKQTIPNTKIIMCVRNPADRAYSAFQMDIKGKNRQLSFNKFKRKYANKGRYFYHLKANVLPFFKKEQIYIAVVEEMKNDLTTEMGKVFSFLGVHDLNFPVKIVEPNFRKTRSRMEDVELNRSQPFYRQWSKFTNTLEGDIRKKITDYYKQDNKQLYDFMGRKIKEWD